MSSRNISKTSLVKNRTRIHVVPALGGWQVRHEGAGRIAAVCLTQAEATEAAQSVLRRSGGALTVQTCDGRIRETLTLGRGPMARIAAVEGIHLSSGSNRLLEHLDRAGASGEERRRSIARRFGKKA